MSREDQPVSKMKWRHRDSVYVNDYNPNTVFDPELDLLRYSLREDGWALPIVIREDGEIVDGEHRWTLSAEPDIYALTDGYIPTVVIPDVKRSKGRQMLSTIRYNRARGIHGIREMAEIVQYLSDGEGMDSEEISRRLGMELEEIERLIDRGRMVKRGSRKSFSAGWTPTSG
jgi:ParB-like chromosome segregation protein Spo0J